jgi:hypothetical protein
MASWTNEMIRGYQAYTAGYIERYAQKIDCADLALASLIDFAYDNGLPVNLKYFSGGWKSYRSQDYSRDNYKSTVLDNLGALSVIDNTQAIEPAEAGAGDLIMSKWNNRSGHTRVIYSVAPVNGGSDYNVIWYQGNLPAVVPERRSGLLSQIEKIYEGKPRRWRFSQFSG